MQKDGVFYSLNTWVLFQYHLDLHRFLYKRFDLPVSSDVQGAVDRIVLPAAVEPSLQRDAIGQAPRLGVAPELVQKAPKLGEPVRLTAKERRHLDRLTGDWPEIVEADFWIHKPSRRALSFLYQVDRATHHEIASYYDVIPESVRRAMDPLVDEGLVAKLTEAKVHHFAINPAKLHAFHKAEMDWFWSQVPGFESYLAEDPPSPLESAALADRMVEHWGPLAGAIASENAKKFVYLLLFYGPLTYSQVEEIMDTDWEAFQNMVQALGRVGLVSHSGKPSAYVYHLDHKVLFQYHFERNQFLSRMRVPRQPLPSKASDTLTLQEKKVRTQLLKGGGKLVDPLWRDSRVRAMLLTLYDTDGLAMKQLAARSGLSLSDAAELVSVLESDGSVRVDRSRPDREHFFLNVDLFSARRKAERDVLYKDAVDAEILLEQPTMAYVTPGGPKQRLVKHWDQTIGALNSPSLLLLVYFLVKRGPMPESKLLTFTGLEREEFRSAKQKLQRAGLLKTERHKPESTIYLEQGAVFPYHQELHQYLERVPSPLEPYEGGLAPLEPGVNQGSAIPARATKGRLGHAQASQAILNRGQTAYWWAGKWNRRVTVSLYMHGPSTKSALYARLGRSASGSKVPRAIATLTEADLLEVSSVLGLLFFDVDAFHRYHFDELELLWGENSDFDGLFGPPVESLTERQEIAERLVEQWDGVASALSSDTRRVILSLLKEYGPTSRLDLLRTVRYSGSKRNFDILKGAKLIETVGEPDEDLWALNQSLLLAYHRDLYRFLQPGQKVVAPQDLAQSPGKTELSQTHRSALRPLLDAILSKGPEEQPAWMRDPELRRAAIWVYHRGVAKPFELKEQGLSNTANKESKLAPLANAGVVIAAGKEYALQYVIVPEVLNDIGFRDRQLFLHGDAALERSLGDPIQDRKKNEELALRLISLWDGVASALSLRLPRVSASVLFELGPLTVNRLASIVGAPKKDVSQALDMLADAKLVYTNPDAPKEYVLDSRRLLNYLRDWRQFLYRDPNLQSTLPPLIPALSVQELVVSKDDQQVLAELKNRGHTEEWWKASWRRQAVLYLYNQGSATLDSISTSTKKGREDIRQYMKELEKLGMVTLKSDTLKETYAFHPKPLEDHFFSELRLFWGDARMLEEKFGEVPVRQGERRAAMKRLGAQWNGVAAALASELGPSVLYLLLKNGPLSEVKIQEVLGSAPDLLKKALGGLKVANLIEGSSSQRDRVYRANRETILAYHRDLYYFLHPF